MEPLLTTEEVAEYLKVEVVTVRRLVTRGELPAYRIGGEFRFIAADVEGFVKSQRVITREVVNMFAKFTERMRRVLEFSNQEADELGHRYIGTEHLLLGLLREGEGVAAKALIDAGHTLEEVRKKTLELIERTVSKSTSHQIESTVKGLFRMGQSVDGRAVSDVIRGRASDLSSERGLTQRAKKVLEMAVEEAKRMDHHYIGTEHLLLGMLHEGEGLGARVLMQDCGLKLEAMRELIAQLLQEIPTTPIPEIPEQAATLLGENEEGVTCGRCNARSPEYFRYCFHCGLKLS